MTVLPTAAPDEPADGAPAPSASAAPPAAVFRGRALPWLFLLPTFVVLALFLYWPAVQTLLLSVDRANIVLGTRQFVGLGNFADLLGSAAYRQIVAQTLLFCVLVAGLGLLLGLALAWLASRPIRGGRVYRLLLIYPYALSPAIAGTLWLFLFNPEVGAVNSLLGALFGVKPRWLDDPALAFALVTAAAVWKGLGYNVVFYLAALQHLPREVLEAAAIDGASGWQSFWRVTFPLLSPMTFFLVFTNVVYALFDSFGLVDILTRGGPVLGETGATTFLIYRLYEDGFRNFNTGLAASQAVLMLIGVGIVTALQFRSGNRRVHYGA